MFIFELLTGQLPYESMTTVEEIDQAVIKGERPLVNEGNTEPSFPGLMDLMHHDNLYQHVKSILDPIPTKLRPHHLIY